MIFSSNKVQNRQKENVVTFSNNNQKHRILDINQYVKFKIANFFYHPILVVFVFNQTWLTTMMDKKPQNQLAPHIEERTVCLYYFFGKLSNIFNYAAFSNED